MTVPKTVALPLGYTPMLFYNSSYLCIRQEYPRDFPWKNHPFKRVFRSGTFFYENLFPPFPSPLYFLSRVERVLRAMMDIDLFPLKFLENLAFEGSKEVKSKKVSPRREVSLAPPLSFLIKIPSSRGKPHGILSRPQDWLKEIRGSDFKSMVVVCRHIIYAL